MTEQNSTIGITLLNKTFDVRCPNSQVDSLQEAAKLLNQKMEEIYNRSHQKNMERITVMAALNISHEWLLAKTENESYLKTMNQRVQALKAKVDDALTQQEDLLEISE